MIKTLLIALLLSPALALAAEQPSDFTGVVYMVVDIVNLLVYLLGALSFIVFLWGIAKVWILSAGDPYEVDQGKQYVFAGFLGLLVMISVFGLVRLLTSSILGM